MRAPLHLADDVFFCVSEGHGVFLDLNQDAYSAVPLVSVELEFADDPDAIDAALAIQLSAHTQVLVEAGLLRSGAGGAFPLSAYRTIERPGVHILGLPDRRAFGLAGGDVNTVRVNARDVTDFARACRRASRSLKLSHIRATVTAVRDRKARVRSVSDCPEVFARQTAIFARLRPWWPRDYLCVFDALALVEFLACRGLFPDWIFGVQIQPFGAHCWVQTPQHVLNESLEYAGQFTPIMRV